MVTAPVTLAGAMDDARGLGISVYQDHDGVRIDAGGIEIMLSYYQASELIGLVDDARTAALIHEVESRPARPKTLADLPIFGWAWAEDGKDRNA